MDEKTKELFECIPSPYVRLKLSLDGIFGYDSFDKR